MFCQYGFNIFDLDIYSKRISFFYKQSDKIGTCLGLILTFLYIIITLILFSFYLSKTIKRVEVKSQESTIYSQGLPSIDINRKIFYFAFALENSATSNRFIDEGIYYPKVYFIHEKKENGIFITKEKINLDIERCDNDKFGEEYRSHFIDGELNNSYCLKDFNLTLVGGSKYEKSSFIEIKIHPCTNNTENNNHCKPQNIIDSHLTSGYFSITMKDIGLNPLNYSFPIIPIIQNLKTNVDITMCRESLIYIGITEVHTDVGLFGQSLKIDQYLEYRKYSQSFFFIDEEEYHNGKEIFGAKIKLEEYIHFQKREYTKMSEVFSITGGYMQLISTIFALITLFTKKLNVEKKIVNKLFNFNIKQRKLILSIQYEKKLNYLIHYEKGDVNYFIPFNAKKNLFPYTNINHAINNNKNENINLCLKENNNFDNLMKKNNSGKSINIKNKIRNNMENEQDNKNIQIIKSKLIFSNKEIFNLNKSKMKMITKDEDLNDINRIFENKKVKKELQSYTKNNLYLNKGKKELLTKIDFNFYDYLYSCSRNSNNIKFQFFNFGVNFYKNQMSIINVFNTIFQTQMFLTGHLHKKNNIFCRIIEIPIKS